jgi:hypothetical protein
MLCVQWAISELLIHESLFYIISSWNFSRLGSIEWHSNAFVIELVAFANGVDEYVAHDLLVGAFELFPHREYCIIGIPSNQRMYKFLRLFTVSFFLERCYNVIIFPFFQKLSPHNNNQLNQEIYVQQRNLCLRYFEFLMSTEIFAKFSLRSSSFSVRRFTIEDYDDLIEELDISNEFFIEAEQSCGLCHALTGIHTFVLLAEDQIVGVCLIELRIHFLKKKGFSKLKFFIWCSGSSKKMK